MSVSGPRFIRRFWAAAGGASALEFAMVLPVFIVILIGTFQFGLAQHKLSSIRYALNITSRSVMLNPAMTEAQAETLVKAQLQDLADPNVTVDLAIVDQVQGRIARLTGNYASYIGIPHLATYPVTFQTTVETSLPAA